MLEYLRTFMRYYSGSYEEKDTVIKANNSYNTIPDNGSYNSNKDEFIYLITAEDLLKVNLKPSNNIVPNPSRNMPPFFDKINLRMLNKAQLDTILSVKLRPIPENTKSKTYPIRHPVLRELTQKIKICN